MEDENDRVNRRGFLSRLIKTGTLVTAGAAILGGGCKCGDEDVDWSDEGSDEGGTEQPPPPKPEAGGQGDEKKESTPESNADS